MILDSNLIFTGTAKGATAGIQSGSYTDKPTTGTQNCSNIIDLGLSGLPASASGGGARDMAVGDNPSLELWAQVTTTFTGGTNLVIKLQGAADNGSGAPGSFTDMWTSPTTLEASLIQGTQLANVTVPRVIPGQALPRFLQLVCVSSGTHSAGEIEAGIVLDRFDQVGVSGTLSGYPAGITVAN